MPLDGFGWIRLRPVLPRRWGRRTAVAHARISRAGPKRGGYRRCLLPADRAKCELQPRQSGFDLIDKPVKPLAGAAHQYPGLEPPGRLVHVQSERAARPFEAMHYLAGPTRVATGEPLAHARHVVAMDFNETAQQADIAVDATAQHLQPTDQVQAIDRRQPDSQIVFVRARGSLLALAPGTRVRQKRPQQVEEIGATGPAGAGLAT